MATQQQQEFWLHFLEKLKLQKLKGEGGPNIDARIRNAENELRIADEEEE